MTEPKAVPGQPFRIPADQFNRIAKSVDKSKQGQRPNTPPKVTPTDGASVEIRNDTGGDLAQGAVVELSTAVIEPTTDDASVVMSGITPTGAGVSFAILEDPIRAGEVGQARTTGAVAVQVAIIVADHDFADTQSGDNSKLYSFETGPVRIIWREAATGSNVWCVVQPASAPTEASSEAITITLPGTTTEPIGSLFHSNLHYSSGTQPIYVWSRFTENPWLLTARIGSEPNYQKDRFSLGLLIEKGASDYTLLLWGRKEVEFTPTTAAKQYLGDNGVYADTFHGPFGWQIFDSIKVVSGSTREVVFNPHRVMNDRYEYKVVDGDSVTSGQVYTWSSSRDEDVAVADVYLDAVSEASWPALHVNTRRIGVCVEVRNGAAILAVGGAVPGVSVGSGVDQEDGNTLWVSATGTLTPTNPRIAYGIRAGAVVYNEKFGADNVVTLSFEQQAWPGEIYLDEGVAQVWEEGKYYIAPPSGSLYVLADEANMGFAEALVKCMRVGPNYITLSTLPEGDDSWPYGPATFINGIPTEISSGGGYAGLTGVPATGFENNRAILHQPPFPFYSLGDVAARVTSIYRTTGLTDPAVGAAVSKTGLYVKATDATAGEEAFGVCEALWAPGSTAWALVVEKGPTLAPTGDNEVLMPTSTTGLIDAETAPNGQYAYQWITNAIGSVDIRRRTYSLSYTGDSVTFAKGSVVDLTARWRTRNSLGEDRFVTYRAAGPGAFLQTTTSGHNRNTITLTDSNGDTVSMPYVEDLASLRAEYVSNTDSLTVTPSFDASIAGLLTIDFAFNASGATVAETDFLGQAQ